VTTETGEKGAANLIPAGFLQEKERKTTPNDGGRGNSRESKTI